MLVTLVAGAEESAGEIHVQGTNGGRIDLRSLLFPLSAERDVSRKVATQFDRYTGVGGREVRCLNLGQVALRPERPAGAGLALCARVPLLSDVGTVQLLYLSGT